MNEKLVFEVTNLIAESDSLGERYNYCDEFTEDDYEIEKGERRPGWEPVGYRDLAIKIIETVESNHQKNGEKP